MFTNITAVELYRVYNCRKQSIYFVIKMINKDDIRYIVSYSILLVNIWYSKTSTISD